MKLNIPSANSKKVTNIFFTYSRFDLIYNLLLIIFSVILNYFNFRSIHKLYNLANMNQFECVIDIIRLTLANICTTITLLVFCFRQRQAAKIMTKIIHISVSLEIFNQSVFKRSLSIVNKIILILVISTFTGCLSNISIVIYTSEVIICFIAKYLCDLINYYVVIEYALILLCVRQLFKTINDNANYIFKQLSNSNERELIQCDYDTLRKDNQNNDEFSRLHDLHLSVYKISEELSDFFALPMLFCLSHVFISLLSYSYYFIRPIISGFQTLPIVLYIHSLFRLTHLAVLFLILTKSATAVIVEVKNQYSFIFQELLNNHFVWFKSKKTTIILNKGLKIVKNKQEIKKVSWYDVSSK